MTAAALTLPLLYVSSASSRYESAICLFLQVGSDCREVSTSVRRIAVDAIQRVDAVLAQVPPFWTSPVQRPTEVDDARAKEVVIRRHHQAPAMLIPELAKRLGGLLENVLPHERWLWLLTILAQHVEDGEAGISVCWQRSGHDAKRYLASQHQLSAGHGLRNARAARRAADVILVHQAQVAVAAWSSRKTLDVRDGQARRTALGWRAVSTAKDCPPWTSTS